MGQEGKAQNPERDPADLLRFRQERTELEKFFAHASRLPADEKAFETRYGTFQENSGVRQFVGALQEVNEMARGLGNPASLKECISEDGNYLFNPEPPAVIYHHLIWLANHIANAASTVKKGYADLAGLFDMPGSPGSRAQGVKGVLVGNGGLASIAARVQTEVRQLTDNLEPFVPRLMQVVRTFNQTTLLNQANCLVGLIEQRGLVEGADHLHKSRDEGLKIVRQLPDFGLDAGCDRCQPAVPDQYTFYALRARPRRAGHIEEPCEIGVAFLHRARGVGDMVGQPDEVVIDHGGRFRVKQVVAILTDAFLEGSRVPQASRHFVYFL